MRRAGAMRPRARVEAITPRWERVQREREQLVAVIPSCAWPRRRSGSTSRDTARLARDLEEIAAARAERKELLRELDSYGELHAEFQRLEVLAREEGRRQALIETRAGARGRAEQTSVRAAQKVETAPKLDSR